MSAAARAKRRWFQFSLGGLLLLTTAIGGGAVFYADRVQRQREVAALVKQHSGTLAYDFQRNRRGRPRGPEWTPKLLGDDFFSDLIAVRARGIKSDDPRLRSIAVLTRLANLDLQDCAAGDEVFGRFVNLIELTRLNLGGTRLGDAGLNKLNRLAKLRLLDVHRTAITDAGLQALRGMTDLEQLDLSGTAIGDRGLESIRHLPRLRYLNLGDTEVSDESLEHLNRLPALVAISLHGSRVTEAGLKRLKACGTLEKPTPPVLDALLALADDTELAFKNQPLSDVLEYISERHGITVVLDGRSVRSRPARDEPKVSAAVRGLRLADALKSILEPLALTYAIRHETLFITASPHRRGMRIEEPSSDLASSSELLAKLGQPANTLGFVEAPLGGLLLSIESQYGIKVRPDESAFSTEASVDEFLETIATVINVRGVSRRSALELTFDANRLECRIRDNALLVRPRKQKPADQE